MTKPTEEQSTIDSLATVLSGGVFVTIGKLLALGFGFFTQIVMARFLTEAAYGQAVLTIAVVNVAGLVAKLGLDDGVMREFPHHEGDPTRAYGVIWASIGIGTVSSLTIAVALYLAAPALATLVFNNASLSPLFRIGAVAIPFIVLSGIAVSLARGARNARIYTYVSQIINPSFRLVLIGTLVLTGLSATGAVVGHFGASVVAALVSFVLTWRVLPSYDVVPKPMYRSVLAFSLPLVAVQGMGFLNTNVDVYMVGYLLESSALGVYNIALQLGNLVTAILTTAGFLLPPMLTRLHEKGQTYEMKRTYQVLTKWMIVLIFPVFIILFFAPELVIGLLFGQRYTGGATALQVLLLGKLFAIVMGLNGMALVGLGANRIVAYITGVQLAVNAAANWFLIPLVGFEGAAVGIALSTVVGDVLGVVVLYRRFGLHPFTRAVFLPVIVLGGVATAGYVFLDLIGVPTAGVILLVGLLYLPSVAALAPEPEDDQLLRRIEAQTGYDLDRLRQALFSIRG